MKRNRCSSPVTGDRLWLSWSNLVIFWSLPNSLCHLTCLFLNTLKICSLGCKQRSLSFFLLSQSTQNQSGVFYPMPEGNYALGKCNPLWAWSSGISSVPWPSTEMSPQSEHRCIYLPEVGCFGKYPLCDLATLRKELAFDYVCKQSPESSHGKQCLNEVKGQ